MRFLSLLATIRSLDTSFRKNSTISIAVSTCNDGILDGNETDVDCGGSCLPTKKCVDGLRCNSGPDCISGVCKNGYENVERKILEEILVESKTSKNKCRRNKSRRKTDRKINIAVVSVEREYVECIKSRKILDVRTNRWYISIVKDLLSVRILFD